MIKIAVVDDNAEFREEIKSYILSYSEESGEKLAVTDFSSGMDFIADYKPVYDVVFLDIEMPLIDGMTVAHKLRKLDNRIGIVFITKMCQYAVEGYDVEAIDFIVKPIKKFIFIDKLKKAISFCNNRTGKEICIRTDGLVYRVPVSSIFYIEKDVNCLIYHTETGILRERGALNKVEQNLKQYGFSRCNSGCLVNLRHVQKISATDITVNGEVLPVSRRRTKELKDDMLNLMRTGGV